ncbi:hypothetical protein TNCV_836551 [Trichonephila clavipes]|nr:hypothetical protein TNCV_836551 [Trichonephila clavipes]
MEIGSLYKGNSIGRPHSEETVDKVRHSFLGVSYSFQANFYPTGYLDKNKEKGYILFLPLQETCWCEYGRKWIIAQISAGSRRAPILNLCKVQLWNAYSKRLGWCLPAELLFFVPPGYPPKGRHVGFYVTDAK